MNNPQISVIIPVYNTGRHLNKCLDSIINQTYRNLQIILVDDGSTDGSGAVCDEYAQKDNRIIVLHQKNSGVSKARNAGIKIAQGDYFYFPDSDDYLETDTFEYLLKRIEEHQCDVINFEYYVTYSGHENIHLIDGKMYGLFDRKEAHRIVIAGEPFAWNKLFSRRLIAGITFREDIFRGEDSLFVHQAIDRTTKTFFDKRPLYHYVQSEQSACRGKFRLSQLSALRLYEAYKPMFRDKYPDIWELFINKLPHLYITIFYDMWADNLNYEEEQERVFSAYKDIFNEISFLGLGFKNKLKLVMFRYAPITFCRLHKKIHHS